RAIAPVDIDGKGVERPGIREAAAQHDAVVLVDAGWTRGHRDVRRRNVRDGHPRDVLGEAAVLIDDLALDGRARVVDRRTRRAAARARRTVALAVATVERVLEAGGRIDRRRVGGSHQTY